MTAATKAKTEKLYQYYRKKGLLPTHARFSSEEDLDRYQAARASFFTDKLHLPPQIFNGASMVEFGPDSGENSLVFARWGAGLTIVEPNPLSWSCLTGYFKRFRLENRLKSMEKTALEDFKTRKKFRFVDAEGFVYTIKPDSVWIKLFGAILEDNGFFIISYYEQTSVLLELILKLIYRRAKQTSGLDSKEIAWNLFKTKWDSIPHTRSFDSWVMDVLDNPFVRLKYFFRADSLCRRLADSGFWLYSSWPNYLDLQSIYWHKKELSDAERTSRSLDYITRSSLSFGFGRKLFICSRDEASVEKVRQTLLELVGLIDAMIDDFNSSSVRKSKLHLKAIANFIARREILSDSEGDKRQVLKLIDGLVEILALLEGKDTGGLIAFCNANRPFINDWGVPAHFCCFRKKTRSR